MKSSRTCFLVISLLLAARTVPATEPPKGSLVIIGGALRYDEMEVWQRVVELAGGPGAKIAVFPTASTNPVRSANRIINALKAAGGIGFLVPVATQKIDVDYHQAVTDPALIAQVREANGVFFTGGEQARIVQALCTEDGRTRRSSTPSGTSIRRAGSWPAPAPAPPS